MDTSAFAALNYFRKQGIIYIVQKLWIMITYFVMNKPQYET